MATLSYGINRQLPIKKHKARNSDTVKNVTKEYIHKLIQLISFLISKYQILLKTVQSHCMDICALLLKSISHCELSKNSDDSEFEASIFDVMC